MKSYIRMYQCVDLLRELLACSQWRTDVEMLDVRIGWALCSKRESWIEREKKKGTLIVKARRRLC